MQNGLSISEIGPVDVGPESGLVGKKVMPETANSQQETPVPNLFEHFQLLDWITHVDEFFHYEKEDFVGERIDGECPHRSRMMTYRK